MTSISTFAQAQSQIDNIKTLLGQVSDLQTQLGTGKKTSTIAGLGESATTTLQSRSQLDSLTTYDQNITNGQTQLNVMNTALTQIQTEANSVQSAMEGETQNGNIDLKSLNSLATNALSFIQNLLNEKNGNNYVFAGSDTSTPPLNTTGTLDTSSQTAVNQWTSGQITTAQFMASFNDPTQMTDATIGYSATLSSGQTQPVTIAADPNSSVDITVLANNPAFRNILTSLTTIQNMTASLTDVSSTSTTPTPGVTTAPGATASEQQANFYQVFNNIISTLGTASTGIDALTSKVGYAQANLQTIQTNHTNDEAVLTNQIGDAENADMNTVATQLSSLQTQLQASYQVMASMKEYTLANYLSTT